MTSSGTPTDRTDSDRGLTVVLVNFRSLANIERQLTSGVLSGHHVIVVDNGDDPTAVSMMCASHDAEAVLIDRNVGFAAAVNRAVSTVQSPDRPWLLLNPDVHIAEDQLTDLNQALTGTVDGVAPLLAGSDGRLQIGPAGGPLTLRSVAVYFLFVSHLLPRLRGIFLTRTQARRTHEVEWLCMACPLLAPDVFHRFGPIPADELVYAEDVAWGTAATSQGARFRLVPSIVVRHDQGASGGSTAWIGAFERLCVRRLGRVRGLLAVGAVRLGLAARRLMGRQVT